ncbi:MAG: RidA family protein [Alphaproteobacteria bacterium]|nr:RidA family protein [Alphaproteobacteria bacterium]
MRTLLPKGWKRPKGYANGIEAQGRLVFVAGQIGWNAEEIFETKDLAGQVHQALANVIAVIEEADAKPHHIVRMTWYIIDKEEYKASVKEIGAVYREVMGNHYPTMSLFEVKSLLEDQAKVEIEATAVIPAAGRARPPGIRA